MQIEATAVNWMASEMKLGRQIAVVYRGQRDSSWPIVSSIDRSGVDKDLEALSLAVLSKLLFMFFNNFVQSITEIISPTLLWLTEDEQSNVWNRGVEASGQHYGIKTRLLDFTFAPSVAVWFACQNAVSDRIKTASVYALPTYVADRLGAQFVWPHPYVRRLYRQRGLFLIPPKDLDLKRVCIEFRFPPDNSFEVLRDYGEKPQLLPADKWWVKIVSLAKAIAASGQAQGLLSLTRDDLFLPTWTALLNEVVPENIDWDFDELFFPAFLEAENKRLLLVEVAAHFIQMLLAFSTAIDPLRREFAVSVAALDSCVTQDPISIRSLFPIAKEVLANIPESDPLRGPAEGMMQLLYESLARKGHTPDAVEHPFLRPNFFQSFRDPE